MYSNESYNSSHQRYHKFWKEDSGWIGQGLSVSLPNIDIFNSITKQNNYPKIIYGNNPENYWTIEKNNIINNYSNKIYYIDNWYYSECKNFKNICYKKRFYELKLPHFSFRGGILFVCYLLEMNYKPHLYGMDYCANNRVYYDNGNNRAPYNQNLLVCNEGFSGHSPSKEARLIEYLNRTNKLYLHKPYYFLDYTLTSIQNNLDNNQIINIYKILSDSGYDYFEIGYRHLITDDEINYIKDEVSKISFNYPCFISIKTDHKNFNIENFDKADESPVELVRFEINKNYLESSISNLKKLKDLNYKVSLIIPDIFDYNNNEFNLLANYIYKNKLDIINFHNLNFEDLKKYQELLKDKINKLDNKYYFDFEYNKDYNSDNSTNYLEKCFYKDSNITFVGTTIDKNDLNLENSEKILINILKNKNITFS